MPPYLKLKSINCFWLKYDRPNCWHGKWGHLHGGVLLNIKSGTCVNVLPGSQALSIWTMQMKSDQTKAIIWEVTHFPLSLSFQAV